MSRKMCTMAIMKNITEAIFVNGFITYHLRSIFPKGSSHFILFCTFSQECVMRKLSSILLIIRINLFIGTAKVSASLGIYGRADTSNIPITPRGRVEFFSKYGYCTMEPHPAENGQKTPFGSFSS